MRRSLVAITVGFTSFATLLFELTQTRILSYIFWNHVVYLTVSLALLGFGSAAPSSRCSPLAGPCSRRGSSPAASSASASADSARSP